MCRAAILAHNTDARPGVNLRSVPDLPVCPFRRTGEPPLRYGHGVLQPDQALSLLTGTGASEGSAKAVKRSRKCPLCPLLSIGLALSNGAPMPNRPASFATDVRLMSAFIRWKALSQWKYTG